MTQNIIEIAERLEKNNPSPKIELVHKNERELFIAVCLSAQTTDKKVNQVTPALFERYPSWEDLASANLEELQGLIRAVNFHKGKAQRLILASRFILEKFGGRLPSTLDELITIPGVARKSANVILNEAFEKAEGIVVDTHVVRLSNRLGLSSNKDPKKIEKDLMKILPEKFWRNFSANLVLHGRYVCRARKPNCESCFLKDICPSAFKA
jgi:endonuclease-3